MKKIFYLLFMFVSATIQNNAQCWQKVSNSGLHMIAIKSNGTLWAWGQNSLGQLGDGTFVDELSRVQILCNSILPVTWLYINGQWENNTAVIKWATASENNTSKFEIEHSNNRNNYSIIGTVAAAGNSNGTQHYSFLHSSPAIGKNHYRIKQIDLDGRFSYSAIIVLQKSTLQTNIIIAPNPVQERVTIFFSRGTNKAIQLINSNGILLLSEKITGTSNSHSLNIRHLGPGTYFLKIQTENGVETHTIIKQ